MTVFIATAAVTLGACVREPLEELCPPIAEGDLAITEVRGQQSVSDTQGQWIELINLSGSPIDPSGLQLRLRDGSGGDEVGLMVRDQDLEIGADGDDAYFVLGRSARDELPCHLDYSYQSDWEGELDGRARIDLLSCGVLIDTVSFDYVTHGPLPSVGSWSLDGDIAPSAEANDDQANWCNDDADVPPPCVNEIGIPGTPQLENRPCS